MTLKRSKLQDINAIPRSLHPSVQAYLPRVKNLARSYTPSLFWERQLATLRESAPYANLEQLGSRAVEAMMAEMGYGFVQLGAGIKEPREDPDYRNAAALADSIDAAAAALTAERFGASKDVWEHARALSFLRSAQLLSDYIEFITPLRIRSSMSVARHYFYARQIAGLARQHCGTEPLRVLEIGAGAGNLAVFLERMGVVRGYCIVDLPEMLLQSGHMVSTYVPAAALTFEPPPTTSQRLAFWFVAPQEIEHIPDAVFDLCLNFNSFAEMDHENLDAYFGLVYRAGRANALFVNVNRRQRQLPQRDGSVFDNNPLLYPYENSDRVLLWEEDAFQQATRNRFGNLPSLAILRAAVINPGMQRDA